MADQLAIFDPTVEIANFISDSFFHMTMAPVLHSLHYSLDFLAEQIADVNAEQMVAQPVGLENHPSWTIGHLTHVLQLIGTVIGIERTLPARWITRYDEKDEWRDPAAIGGRLMCDRSDRDDVPCRKNQYSEPHADPSKVHVELHPFR